MEGAEEYWQRIIGSRSPDAVSFTIMVDPGVLARHIRHYGEEGAAWFFGNKISDDQHQADSWDGYVD